MATKTWTWKVTYQTATIASGSEPTQALAEAKAVQVHDRNVILGLNPDWLAWHASEDLHPTHAANRAARVAAIVAELDKLGEQPDAQLRRIDNDPCWFRAWTAALGYGATCPSEQTRHDVREVVRARIPEPTLAEEFRDVLEELERARQRAASDAFDHWADDGFDTCAEAEMSR